MFRHRALTGYLSSNPPAGGRVRHSAIRDGYNKKILDDVCRRQAAGVFDRKKEDVEANVSDLIFWRG